MEKDGITLSFLIVGFSAFFYAFFCQIKLKYLYKGYSLDEIAKRKATPEQRTARVRVYVGYGVFMITAVISWSLKYF